MHPDVRRVVLVRTLRGFADGFVSVLLARHLVEVGFTPLQIGLIVTGTLVGSATLTLLVGLTGVRLGFRALLLGASALMVATGLGFFAITAFVPLLVIAFVGTLNPSAGDVSVFLPTEQAFLADHAAGGARTRIYAFYNVGGNLAGALGALASGAITGRIGFLLYVAVAAIIALVYRGLPPDEPPPPTPTKPLEHSRTVVLHLAALFSLDSAGGGLVVQSLLVVWLYLRFDLSTASTATVFFCAGTLAAFSQLLAPRLASRIGLVRTMVFTHLPANVFLILAALVPHPALAIGFLLLRSLLSQMDVPARQALVMAAVLPAERAAAASVTNVPRSLAAAATPALAGWLLASGYLAAPLVLAGSAKAGYDLLLLWRFRSTVLDHDRTT
ncbi:Predicted arabinose efflux permease, MFS family [Asanoa hainanensis]|uniref:Predicted arabinose efflux permease, MFS family n=1 Tax=Asanoa hainanensis TaxID=560556 RepID=A0A239P1V3_9ACTN|nr:MFS transporter [Asanoa hainanensis]SNT60309.1 Predicted arabinose efflux permease, MFS family [Asanoa hainanensis]